MAFPDSNDFYTLVAPSGRMFQVILDEFREDYITKTPGPVWNPRIIETLRAGTSADPRWALDSVMPFPFPDGYAYSWPDRERAFAAGASIAYQAESTEDPEWVANVGHWSFIAPGGAIYQVRLEYHASDIRAGKTGPIYQAQLSRVLFLGAGSLAFWHHPPTDVVPLPEGYVAGWTDPIQTFAAAALIIFRNAEDAR